MTLYRTVIAAHAGDEPSSDGLALARLLAEVTGARLLIAHVAAPRAAAAGERLLEDLVRGSAPGLQVETRLVECASVPRGLHDLAEAEGADLIALGSCRHGRVGRVVTGSVAERLIQGAPCAVAVAPRGFAALGATYLHRIAVAFDGTPESEVALHHGAAVAGAAGARLRLLAAAEPVVFPAFVNVPAGDVYAQLIRCRREALERQSEAAVAGLPHDVPVETRLMDGTAVEAICKEAKYGVDLLVVGSRGWGPVRRVLLGSVSSRLLHVAPCPVLVVPRGPGVDEVTAAQSTEAVAEPA